MKFRIITIITIYTRGIVVYAEQTRTGCVRNFGDSFQSKKVVRIICRCVSVCVRIEIC